MSPGKLLIIAVLILLAASPVQSRDYSVDGATTNVEIAPEGLVHVTESISYSFEGQYNEVFRQIQQNGNEYITDIEIRCEPVPCKGRTDIKYWGWELVGELPKPTPEKITLHLSYKYVKGLKVHDDVSELHFKLWGEEWEKPLGRMEAAIRLPEGAGADSSLWLTPGSLTRSEKLEGDTIYIESKKIPAKTWYEIRVAFPRLENPDPQYVKIETGEAMDNILKIQKEYERRVIIENFFYLLAWFMVMIALAGPFYIYYQFGREPKVDYTALYEREAPYDSKPAAVNAIMRGKVGKPDIEGFLATVMDLVHRSYLDIHEAGKDVVLEIKGRDESKLADFEKGVMELLSNHSQSGSVSWKRFKKELGKDSSFYNFINSWNRQVERHVKVEKLFISKGNDYLKALGAIAMFSSVLGGPAVLAFFPPEDYPGMLKIFLPGIFLFVVGFITSLSSFINEKGAGRFTPEGRLFTLRWKNFRRYLTDFSALKQHPPESIKLWDQYMVYAVALGVAKKVMKNMSHILPKSDFESSNFHGLRHHGGFYGGFNRAYMASNPNKSTSGGSYGGGIGGVGGVGGGFGGGGGGAR